VPGETGQAGLCLLTPEGPHRKVGTGVEDEVDVMHSPILSTTAASGGRPRAPSPVSWDDGTIRSLGPGRERSPDGR